MSATLLQPFYRFTQTRIGLFRVALSSQYRFELLLKTPTSRPPRGKLHCHRQSPRGPRTNSATNGSDMPRLFSALACCLVLCSSPATRAADAPATPGATKLRAGAAAVDVSPTQFPVIINGSFLQNVATKLS